MESQDSPEDHSIELLSVPATKRRKTSNFDRCIICQGNSNETLRRAKELSVHNFIEALKKRQDDVYYRLLPELSSLKTKQVLWHSRCYETCTSKQNLAYVASGNSSQTDPDSLNDEIRYEEYVSTRKRSGFQAIDWSKCIFCKNRTHKKVRDMLNICTFEACESIMSCAQLKGDEEMLHLLRGVNNDLVAAEAKYHKACHASYVSKSNLKHTSFHEGGKTEEIYAIAFQELLKEITPSLVAGKAYTMTSLLLQYKQFLEARQIKSESYSTQRLKLRLKKHFGEEIVFHQPSGHTKSELIYSSSISIQDVINAAFKMSPPEALPAAKSFPEKMNAEQLLFYTAQMMKSEIVDCKGISIQPLSITDLTLASSKSILPPSVYWLLRWLITDDGIGEDTGLGMTSECRNVADERKIIMLAQDIVHSASHARVKTPKHACLATAVRHLTGSKQLITILNRLGHCSSYDEVERIDTSLAEEILAKSEQIGTVIPSNISPGVFIQTAADNNDINEETLDGKNTTHSTTIVMYQRRQFGPCPKPQIYADHTRKRRSLENLRSLQTIQEFGAFGKRPSLTDFVGLVNKDWFASSTTECQFALNMDLAWALVRMCPTKLFTVEIELIERQTETQRVPGWSGYNAMVFPNSSSPTVVGYCPMIDASPTEYSTIYTVLKYVQSAVTSLGQHDSVITFDLAIYTKAKEIQWRSPEEFSDTVIRLGGFHIALNYLALLGKKFDNSGLEDLLIESGVYSAGTTSVLMQGKSYNRGIRAHKLCLEAFLRLFWDSFSQWYRNKLEESGDETGVNEEDVLAKIHKCWETVEKRDDKSVEVDTKSIALVIDQSLDPLLKDFRTDGKKRSELFAFWDEYVSMVMLLLQFIKAERTGNWHLHLSTTASMIPHFFALDRQNYSRWLPVYLCDMNLLTTDHPDVYREFLDGQHSVSRSSQPFSQVWTDMALEQSVNLDSKSNGGIIGISQKPEALQRWFLTSHERAAITTALKEMCEVEDSERVGTHKEAAPKRVQRDEEDIKKLIQCFSSNIMRNPFDFESEEDEVIPLMNFATGVVMPSDISTNLVNATEQGRERMNAFLEKRLNSNEVNFWEPLKQQKVKTFKALTKKTTVKGSSEKLITVDADRNLFGRLLITANSREVNLKEVLSFELTSVPFALSHSDGSLRKTNKSVLLSILETEIDVHPTLPLSQAVSTAYIIDGMALIQMIKSGGAATFGELAMNFYDVVTKPLNQRGCERVDIVFDRYWSLSIKAGERQARGGGVALEIRICTASTPIPKQWQKYISNPTNKTNLRIFLSESLCELGQERLGGNQRLVIGGGFRDGEKSVSVLRGRLEIVSNLLSNHEEADTRLLLHANHAAQHTARIVIKSPDTDVAVLSIAHFSAVGCRELWFCTGVKDRHRFIPIHSISQRLGEELCQALPAFHAITGCDSTSSLSGVGKTKAWKALMTNKHHQASLATFGNTAELSQEDQRVGEAFACSLYTTSKKAGLTADDLRYWMFCQRKQKTEGLPPTSDSLLQHLKRASYQVFIWRQALTAIVDLPVPQDNGWKVDDTGLHPVLMTKEPAPASILELITCRCKKSQCNRNCSCNSYGMPCTESCLCMADEGCHNSYNLMNDSSDSEDSD